MTSLELVKFSSKGYLPIIKTKLTHGTLKPNKYFLFDCVDCEVSLIVDKTKSQLEQHRVQRAMRGDDTAGGRMDDTESDLKDTMEHAKRG